jgi:hypothetical protein
VPARKKNQSVRVSCLKMSIQEDLTLVSRKLWSCDRRTYTIDIVNSGIGYHHVFALPPCSENDRSWPWHYTPTGLEGVLLDLCCDVCKAMEKYKHENAANVDLQTLFPRLWLSPMGQHQLCPQFEIVSCIATRLAPPSHVLHCKNPRSRELFLDSIIKNGEEHFKLELHFKLGKSWLNQTIWRHHVLRRANTHPDVLRDPSLRFISRLKHH